MKTQQGDIRKSAVSLYLLVFCISVLLEIFGFNFRAIQSIFYQEKNVMDYYVQLDYATVSENGDFIPKNDVFVLSVVLDSEKIHNMYVNAETLDEQGIPTGKCEVQLHVQDELLSGGDSLVRAQIPRKIFRDIPASQYLFYTSFGDTQMLQLNFYPGEGRTVRIHKMSLDAKRPFLISWRRIVAVFVLGALIMMFRPGSELWKRKALEPGRWGKTVCFGMFFLLLLSSAVWLLQNELYKETDFQPYQELARALAQGKCDVGEANEKVQALEGNLVSWGANSEGVKFDHALYQGRYYVYFGVLPCLLFYLPWYLITGTDLSDSVVQWILIAVIIIGLYNVLIEIIKRYFRNTSLAMLLLFMIAMTGGTYLPAILSEPLAYNVAILMGVCLVVWGIWCWLKAGERTRQIPVKRGWLCLGSFFMAAVAASRPTLLLYSLLLFPIIAGHYMRKPNEEKSFLTLRDILAICVPYFLVACGTMYYNYIRFDDPFQFGMLYNLTSVPSRCTAFYYPELIWISVYEYFLRPPMFDWEFPFLTRRYLDQFVEFSGTLIYYQTVGVGMVAANPILLPGIAFLGKGQAWKKKRTLLITLSMAIVIGSFLLLFSGIITQLIASRYSLEVSFVFFVLAAVAFFDKEESGNITAKARTVISLTIIICVTIQLLQVFSDPYYPLAEGNEVLFYKFYYSFHC